MCHVFLLLRHLRQTELECALILGPILILLSLIRIDSVSASPCSPLCSPLSLPYRPYYAARKHPQGLQYIRHFLLSALLSLLTPASSILVIKKSSWNSISPAHYGSVSTPLSPLSQLTRLYPTRRDTQKSPSSPPARISGRFTFIRGNAVRVAFRLLSRPPHADVFPLPQSSNQYLSRRIKLNSFTSTPLPI